MTAAEYAGFEEFVRARTPRLLRFARALTGDEAAACDLLQDALERTLPRWRRVTSSGDPERYLRKVMLTRHVSLWRRVRRETLTADVPERGRDDPQVVWDGPVWAALSRLPARQRAVLALRYYEDLDDRDIADLMGISVGTVKSQASRAMAKLRVVLEDQAPTPLPMEEVE